MQSRSGGSPDLRSFSNLCHIKFLHLLMWELAKLHSGNFSVSSQRSKQHWDATGTNYMVTDLRCNPVMAASVQVISANAGASTRTPTLALVPLDGRYQQRW